jgi:2-polyprenyl-3-methyl-5-hydroxy-6-metoxy-1,4-benzoquinol methylase
MLQSGQLHALPCPVCGSITSHAHLFRKNDCEILRCMECGLGRAEARDFDPAGYYTQDYFSGGHADGYANYLGAERVLRREFARTVQFIRKHCDGGRLLELGCAYGFFLQEAKRYFDVVGIELAEDAAAHCRRNGLRVLTGVADDQRLGALGSTDVIVLLDVIEHLPEPHETLALCARHLRPGGIVVLTTGDFGSTLARMAGASWRLMTPPQHLWFFTAASIERLAARLAMHVEALDHPWKIVPASLILFQLGLKYAGAAPGSRLGVPVNLFDAMRIVLRRTAAP